MDVKEISMHDRFPRGHGHDDSPEAAQSTFIEVDLVKKTETLLFTPDNKAGRIFLGVVDGDTRYTQPGADGRIDRYTKGGTPIGVSDDSHIVTIAGSRSGKGRCAITPNLLSYPGSVLVIDPKGDLAITTVRYRSQTLKQQVYVLDPFGSSTGQAKKHLASYNPLDFLDPNSDTLIEDAGLISDALVVPSSDGDPHWDETARNLIEGLVLHVATYPAYRRSRHLPQVYDLLMQILEEKDPDDADIEYMYETEMKDNSAAFGAVQMAAAEFFDKSERERDSVLSTARRHLRFLGYQRIRAVLMKSSFNLEDLKTNKISVYLSLPAMRMGTCSRWLRLFVNLTLAAMEKVQARPPYPVLMCLDEFAVLGHMKSIEDAAGQIAGLGVKLWPILQDLGQLKALYKDRWETFLGNAGVLQFFGNNDLTTLEWISKRLGDTTILTESQSSPSFDAEQQGGTTGRSWSHTTHPLMTPEEVSRFFGRHDYLQRQLIFRGTFKPMVLQRAAYDKHELFAGRFDQDRYH